MGQVDKTQLIQRDNLKLAVDLLKAGKLVAFPTETVFGLGALARNEEAVSQVFQVKGRPSDNPLIVHVSGSEQVYQYIDEVGEIHQQLMDKFWPGPLSIIFPMRNQVFPQNVSGGGNSVAMRMPAQMESLLLIKMLGEPIVGPSANLSGKPSPTQVDHVLADFNGKIAGIIDPQTSLTDFGVESTVVKIENNQVYILRPGAITQDMLSEALGFPVIELTSQDQISQSHIQSPGVKYKHYSPKQPVIIIPAYASPDKWLQVINSYEQVGILADQTLINQLSSLQSVVAAYSLGLAGDIKAATQNLYAGLRALENSPSQIILAQSYLESPESHAYMNRLNRAGIPIEKRL